MSRVAEYVNAMARDARFAGAEVVLCTLPPNRPRRLSGYRSAVIAAYNTALRDVARGEGALLVDFERDVDISLIGLDGLHPTEAGYARMADVLFEADPPALRVEPRRHRRGPCGRPQPVDAAPRAARGRACAPAW